MTGRTHKFSTAVLLICLLIPFVVSAEQSAHGQLHEKQEQSDLKFIRLLRGDDRKPQALQVSIVRYVPRDNRSTQTYVDLVSAIHVADQAYYADLNRRFKDYDAVLFELVAPEDTQIPFKADTPEPKERSLLSRFQLGLKDTLGLSFQLDEVDYTGSNMVHADMSPEEFDASMERRGESMFTMFAQMWLASLSQSLAPSAAMSDIKLIQALFSSDREHALKVFAAEQFASAEGMFKALEGKEGSTLVTERNKKALRVLERELANGKQRIAIFYGAAHMDDMGARLETDFGLTPSTESWVDAWNLQKNGTP